MHDESASDVEVCWIPMGSGPQTLVHFVATARVSLDPSPDFTASLVDNEEEDSHCLCANERKTLSWTVVPKSLGEINFIASAETLGSDQPCENVLVEKPIKRQKDTVIRSVLVEKPEGIQKQVVFNSILSASENAQSTPSSLELPKNVVEGSARASFCVLGYQTQLRYKHPDGSYSTFGPLGEETGNTWLTAFVLKSFGQARCHIFVDGQHIADAQASLAAQQKENGCFRSFGSLLNNALKGGLDDEVKHSAYITSALLEISLPVTQSLVRNALFCLEREAQTDEVDIYTQALLAYVFTLAEKEDKRKEMLQLLEANAVKEEDGSIHWQQPREQEKKAFSPLNNHQTRSVDIVMTSYVLLAHVEKKPAPSPEEMSISSRIAKWLTGQQNPTGGFLSTQDTVVALQALSKYSTLDYSQSRAVSKVSLSSGADFQKEFHVDSTNSLLLQSQALPKVPGNYQAEVTGGRSVLLQTTLKYNVHPDQEEPPFKLDLHTVPEACMDPKAQTKFALALNLR
ncbi:Pregnancy zone protein [Varanus komodoensis]|nr:Pregnancy zone protein [Varanus komodoensis]